MQDRIQFASFLVNVGRGCGSNKMTMSKLEGKARFYWGGLTRAVEVLLYLNFGVFVLMLLMDDAAGPGGGLTRWAALYSDQVKGGAVWQLFTYMFLHSSYLIVHIAMNMAMLALLGPDTERLMGLRHFVAMYLFSGVIGGLLHVFASHTSAPTVGASGALMGVVGAFVAMNPKAKVFVPLFPFLLFQAWIVEVVFLLFQVMPIVVHHQSNVAYWVHLGGGLAGFAYTVFIYRPAWLPWGADRRLKVDRPVDVEEDRFNAILDKYHLEGSGSLTQEEYDILVTASRSLSNRKV